MAKSEDTEYTITFRVDIRDRFSSGLSIAEDLKVTGKGLFELAGVLHQVHELAERIRDEQAGLAGK